MVSGDLKRVKYTFIHLSELQKLGCVLLKSKATVLIDSLSGGPDSAELATLLVHRVPEVYKLPLLINCPVWSTWTFNTVLRNVNTTSTQFPFKHGRVYTTKPLETTLSFRMRIYKTLAEHSTCSRSHSLPTITITLFVWVFNAKQTRWDHSFHKWLSFYYASSISLFSSCSQDNLTMERNYIPLWHFIVCKVLCICDFTGASQLFEISWVLPIFFSPFFFLPQQVTELWEKEWSKVKNSHAQQMKRRAEIWKLLRGRLDGRTSNLSLCVFIFQLIISASYR